MCHNEGNLSLPLEMDSQEGISSANVLFCLQHFNLPTATPYMEGVSYILSWSNFNLHAPLTHLHDGNLSALEVGGDGSLPVLDGGGA